MKTLLAWVGFTDIRSANEKNEENLGPLGQALVLGGFECMVLITDADEDDRKAVSDYLTSLVDREVEIILEVVRIESPIDFREIYPISNKVLEAWLKREPAENITLHFSPGTAVMQSIWILLAAKSGAHLIQTSRELGLQDAEIPFDIHAEYVPDLVRGQGTKITRVITEPGQVAPGFKGILFKSQSMASVIDKAQKIAAFDIPVLIEGESGTGKELFARAIHDESSRRDGPYRAINCGAIPESLIDSELFGYEKGAFTGADNAKAGEFESANGGTLFLDEIGELPRSAQTRLLRVLQVNMVRRVGPGAKETPVDVRIIAATNRDLIEEMREGKFREDLYFRVAATSIHLPALRDRSGDVEYLIDLLLERKCRELGVTKTLAGGARNKLTSYSWPGNVRELEWTIARAIVLSASTTISPSDMTEAIKTIQVSKDDLLHRPLGAGFVLEDVLGEIKDRYVRKALDQTKNRQSQAAKLLGMSQQSLSYYLKQRAEA